MIQLNKSPERNTFQANKYLERKAEEGKTPENDENVAAMMEYYKSESERKKEREQDPAWRENNLEYDLRSTTWICDKVKASEDYAQNLYAAMCNNEFQRNDLMPILKDQRWSCSWRYAGGIVADMREQGDYIDWYCSGIRGGRSLSSPDDPHPKWVSESVITDEIRLDLKRLGWLVVDESPDDKAI